MGAYKRVRKHFKRRYTKKRVSVSRSVKQINNKIHRFTRVVQYSNESTTNSSAIGVGVSFALSDLPQMSDFTNLFSEIRLVYVDYRIVPCFSQWEGTAFNGTTNAQDFYLPNIYSAIDNTNASIPSSLNVILEYSNMKMTQGNKIHERKFCPALLAASYESSISTAYTPKYRQWLSTSDISAPHYALRYYLDPPGTGMTVSWRVFCKYTFECRNPK